MQEVLAFAALIYQNIIWIDLKVLTLNISSFLVRLNINLTHGKLYFCESGLNLHVDLNFNLPYRKLYMSKTLNKIMHICQMGFLVNLYLNLLVDQ